MIIRLTIPFLYSVLLGGVWGAIFKKKFSSSLAPAFMLHIIIVLLSGMIFGRLSVGVYGGIGISFIVALGLLFRSRNGISRDSIIKYINKIWSEGLFIFLIFYVFCFFFNHEKRFLLWDEFSHWGWFIKESLRLDSLYCTSPLGFDHKDYVPAITLFEAIMCKLNRRYAEADVYRAIQILMFSMLMPMFEAFDSHSGKKSKNRLLQLSSVFFALLIPLIFNTSNGFLFYHSIYCDMAVGFVFFWCVYESYRDHESVAYKLFVVSIGLTVLVLSKMMAMALMPLVILLLLIVLIWFSDHKPLSAYFVGMVPVMLIPVGVWCWYNKFVDRYVANTGYGQSYDGMKLSSIKQVFTSPENSTIPYLGELREVYIDALIHRDILLHGSYVVTLLFLVMGFFALASASFERAGKRKMVIVALWSLCSGIFYGFLMFFLYATAFVESEAIHLASYERYINSFVISVVLLLLAVYYDSEIWKRNIKGFCAVVILLVMDLSFLHIQAFDQVLPGTLTHDEEKVRKYMTCASIIMSYTNEDDSIYVVKRGDTGDFLAHLYYYCSPRVMYGGSIGSPVDDDDVWSIDISRDELVNGLGKSDYVYFCGLDEAFIEEYSEVFDSPNLLIDGAIYRVRVDDSKVYLTGV